MNLMEIALRAGVPPADIELLIRGHASQSVANRLGVPMLGLEDFMANGIASANVAHRLGTSMNAAEELARAVGPQGAIGIVLGLLLSAK
jgi:hypothetical protein